MGTTSAVGATTLPVPAGASLSAISDPIVDALIDFLGFVIKDALDAKLAVLTPTSANACPATNRYTYDPRAYWVRNPTPALYVWWSGRSKVVEHSTVYDRRERDIGLFYVFDELVGPDGQAPRAGLMAAVDAAITRASSLRYHPSYGYNGWPNGTPLHASIGADVGFLGWQYKGGQVGAMVPVPSDARQQTVDGAVVRFYPALQGTITVSEKIGGFELEDPADVLGDVATTITNDGSESNG